MHRATSTVVATTEMHKDITDVQNSGFVISSFTASLSLCAAAAFTAGSDVTIW